MSPKSIISSVLANQYLSNGHTNNPIELPAISPIGLNVRNLKKKTVEYNKKHPIKTRIDKSLIANKFKK